MIHTHSNYATAFAAVGRPIPLCLTAIADEFGVEIPCAPYVDNEGDHIGQAILTHRNRAPAILLGNHGVFAWGPTPRAALKAAVMTEDVAKTVHLAMQIGQPAVIPPEEAEKWYQRYHSTYGQESYSRGALVVDYSNLVLPMNTSLCRIYNRISAHCSATSRIDPDRPRLAGDRASISASCWAWPGGWSAGARTRRPTTSWPAATWAGGSSGPRSSPRTSARSTSWGWPARAPRTAWPWPITNCTPGACWCWPGCSCRSTPARWCSPCPSSWNGGSRAGSRYVLSVVSLITFVVSKIAVGIFAGGVVFATLLPEVHLQARRGIDINSFWIGSVLVIVLDRPVHDAGRHAGRGLQRRRADDRPHHRLGHADHLRPVQAGRLERAAPACAAPTCSTSGSR